MYIYIIIKNRFIGELYRDLKNSLSIHDENIKENHKRVVSLYVIKIRVTLSWTSLQIFLNILSLRKQKLPNIRKELAYKTFCFLSRSKNSQYVLYRTQDTRHPPRVLYPIKHSCSFFKHYLKYEAKAECLRPDKAHTASFLNVIWNSPPNTLIREESLEIYLL